MAKPTVLIAEDNFIIREGLLKPLLEPAFTVVAVDNGRDVAAAVTENNPEIVLLDISLPGRNGFEAARELLQFEAELYRPVCVQPHRASLPR